MRQYCEFCNQPIVLGEPYLVLPPLCEGADPERLHARCRRESRPESFEPPGRDVLFGWRRRER